MKKNYTYSKYNASTWPGHLSHQFKTEEPALTEEDVTNLNEALAEQASKMSPEDKKRKAAIAGQGAVYASTPREDEQVDTTPWMPELYENGADSSDPFDVK